MNVRKALKKDFDPSPWPELKKRGIEVGKWVVFLSHGSKVEMTIGYVDQEAYQDKVWVQKMLSITSGPPELIPWGPAGVNMAEVQNLKLCSELTSEEQKRVVRGVFHKYSKSWKGQK